ncbi:related to putative multispanning membrane protein [Cephalotrichum gorgonifer]|uniref:Transmembrane 9 superfamily member n=1 Tax=Cephalotrichum gorgonifer TaxID=2041049 RepID=A0AAE8MT02_9PEZI|nr:related to putative multispanning membrane protein [Cephalotrichum gorgonifer]
MRNFIATGLGALASLAAIAPADAFYIPGWSIRSYKDGEQIPLLFNKVYSDNTQLQYAYYDLPFVCAPTGREHSTLFSGQNVPLNLGEVLRGDRIRTSDVDLVMGPDKECAVLCNLELDRAGLRRARELVQDGYVVEWIVDNLPGATRFVTVDKSRKYYAAGFKLGSADHPPMDGDEPTLYLNNHHTIVVRWRRAPGRAGDEGGKVIVGFEVYPKSIAQDEPRNDDGCPLDLQSISRNLELRMPPKDNTGEKEAGAKDAEEDDGTTMTIPYTYSVFFREDKSVEWAQRWDLYFVNQEDGNRIHWLAIINSLIICGVLSAVVTVILAKTIRADIKGHRDAAAEEARKGKRKAEKKPAEGLLGADAEPDLSDEDDDDTLEDLSGWKLLHGDVFRTPPYGYLLAPLVGSGAQLLLMALALVLLSALGVLNPSFRGGFVSVGVGLFVFNGLASGYFSAQVFKTLEGQNWRGNALLTALLFPGLLFSLVFMLNLFVWAQASSTAIPFGTLVAMVLLWLCIQVPLVYVGSWYGYTRSAGWEHPVKTLPASAPARAVPPRPWYARTLQTALLAGLIPFAVIFIELLFVFRSVWQDKSGYYYVFGFMAVVSAILLVTVAEVTVVAVFAQLCAEDPRWMWRSFLVGGSSAVWVFAYCAWYYLVKLNISGWVSGLMFFGYSFMGCCVYGLLTGTVGFLSAYAFVRRIYGAIKVD